jgi:choline dehydrogenase-like flavoprotein
LNLQVLVPPSAVGIDNWARLGNKCWDWKILAPYFQKIYTTEIPSGDAIAQLGLERLKRPDYTATSGLLKTSYTYSEPREAKLAEAWIETFKALGYETGTDLDTGGGTGAFLNATTVDGVTKERSYSASTYYKPIQDRPNLHLMTGVTVEKILFDTSDPLVIVLAYS